MELKGEILVSSNTGALVELLPAMLAAYLKKHPDINVHLHEKPSGETVHDLQNKSQRFDLLQPRRITADWRAGLF